ncbi:hypothetical protein EDC65_1974 [Stella humosa]|uniref:Uncharacterized protein n=1 Tax=Stella humosa TaxID=94 RepID=A0A3N1M929_9PROT|nr:hypothetical protein [Stella humosa]ROQ00178.1 hypothetical protein EDC65_1974 [Stella humosa]BBK30587.1 hypothetical protein STHU_12210 [Stella humosa]
MLEWGARADLLEARAAGTGIVPPALASRPEIAPWADPYWRAFLDLSRERLPAGAIPLAAIRTWLDEEQVRDPVLRGEFRELVVALDQQWLAASRPADAGTVQGE